mmetsp:Transcript_6370/g.10781  ORF Transcript_6370/g.10781 Transcript_6370/m.10781 type:complete len:293 (+) Transcript_6370:196-1074(+)
MEPGEYEGMVAKASSGSTSAATDLLHFMRTHKVHQPELVLLHGCSLLSNCPRKLGNDVWTVMEQVFLAATEMGSTEWRDYCIKHLSKKFPTSIRVERLKGIYKESQGDWQEANNIYKKILTDKPEDTMTRKRMIAMYKQRGKIPEAIEEINKYLETFSTDAEVWHELAELYIEAGSLTRALYCFEELILANSRSMYYILTYAELLYSTASSTSDYELARKYFSLASYLDGDCLRALWGLVAVNMVLAEKDKSNDKLVQMNTFALDRLKSTYKNAGGSHGKVAVGLITSGAFA